MIRINQLKLKLNADETELSALIKKGLRLKAAERFTYEIARKSIDARRKDSIMYVYSVDVRLDSREREQAVVTKLNNNNIMLTNEEKYVFPSVRSKENPRIVIAGSGPAGLFCGLFLARAGFAPVIYERGASVDERVDKVNRFWQDGILDCETNVQFGEGGAGTFSDGKLNTAVKDKSGRIRKVLETFVEFGANPEIKYISKPHIGTDILKNIVRNIRNEIERLGGKVIFNAKVADIYIEKNTVKGVKIREKGGKEYDDLCDRLVLAPGHSARDTFEMLCGKGMPMERKAFAVGLRIEHPQKFINRYMYGDMDSRKFPAADYKVTAKASGGRGVYSFCMCPGGYVVNASSEQKMLCVNGMSYSGRSGINANSAVVVTVSPEDFGGNDVLGGMYFQRRLESAAYKTGGGLVPYQLNEDFASGRKSTGYGNVVPQIKGGASPADLREIFPEYISETIIDGMKTFDKIIRGFNMPEAVFSGVESRTSSPVRILRDEGLESISLSGIYPCGEGAGYAGGITSAAVDGIKTAEAVAASVT